MAGGVVYHWRHGWIPLDHVAALSKAKGNHERAAKYMAAAHEAKGIHSRQDLAKAILDLPNVTDPTHRAQAKASIDEAAHRLGAQDLLPGSGKPTPGPADAREAFRMGGPELRQHAANGSPVAQAELDRRAAKHGKPSAPTVTKAPATPAAPPKPATAGPAKPPTPAKDAALARWESENRAAAPAGYTVQSRVSSTEAGGVLMGQHTLYSSTNERVGSVLDRKNGQFLALYNGKQLGAGYPTRRGAFAALAAKHEAVAAAERKKADLAARRQANAVPIGIFKPRVPQGDGTVRGDAAAAKIKQSFTVNDHTVNIETAMSKEQTKGFLDDVHAVLLKSGHLDSKGIVFHVPSGDPHFRQTRRGITGGYVRQGQRTVFMNPKLANGSVQADFEANGGGHLMPAASHTSGRQYALTHELGHILDAQNGDTHETSFLGSHQVAWSAARSDVSALHKEQRANLSRYGQTNVSEGYAEAYAQWVHGGPGSSPAADAYAAKFGWKAPKWYREGIRR